VRDEFREFLVHRRLKILWPVSDPAQSVIRLVYKAMQCGLEYKPEDVARVTETDADLFEFGSLYQSHYDKFQQLDDWAANPFAGKLKLVKVGQKKWILQKIDHVVSPSVRKPITIKRTFPGKGGPFEEMLDKWREKARVRAEAAREANPNLDFWAIAEWLERNYEGHGGSITKAEEKLERAKKKAASKTSKSSKASKSKPTTTRIDQVFDTRHI
jgi:hypothetical protein